MERGRKTKIITIVALVVAIVTMSLGFAVFSNVLTISSSATVKPNAEDYIINIYGPDQEIPLDVINSSDNTVGDLLSYFTSKTTGVPILEGAFDATPAIIDNRNFAISNLNMTFSNANQGVHYLFMIKNEGKKSVYINLDFAQYMEKTCVAETGGNQTLVDGYCAGIASLVALADSSGNGSFGSEETYELLSNDFVFVLVSVAFVASDSLVVEEEFNVNFDNVELEFSSVDNSQSS